MRSEEKWEASEKKWYDKMKKFLRETLPPERKADVDAIGQCGRLMCHIIAIDFHNNTYGEEGGKYDTVEAFVKAHFLSYWPDKYTEQSKVSLNVQMQLERWFFLR